MEKSAKDKGRPTGRALRRHHAARLKRRQCKRNAGWLCGLSDEFKRKKTGILLHTPKVCSCFMCGNPRKYLGEPTLQEESANQQALHAEDANSDKE